MNWSARRINKIAKINNAQTYLEIGVNNGQTFLDVDIAFKDGVDPVFRFDTKSVESDKVRFFTQTSDAFWTQGQARSYDVIMIDGLHTFEQTFRDLLASFQYAHRKTVWLIDDTLPSDVFSAMPDQTASYRERGKLKVPGRPWHGDVFKIIPTIHDFLPTLNYVTIFRSGNPQTLAWYGPRQNFKPRVNNLETISRMGFFDIQKVLPLFKFASEDAAFEALGAAFAD